METAVFTNMCMICDGNGRVVVQERTNQNWPGIAFPGGHVEPGESFTDAVIREVWEETGLTISQPRLCGIKNWIRDDGTRYIVFLYKATQFKGDLTSSEEGRVWWIPAAQLPDMHLAEGLLSTLEMFFDTKYSEQFLYKKDGAWIRKWK